MCGPGPESPGVHERTSLDAVASVVWREEEAGGGQTVLTSFP